MKAFLFVASIFLSAPAMAADEFTSGDLLRTCKDANIYLKGGSTNAMPSAMLCLGYLRGVIEGYTTMLEVTPTMDRVYCVPPELTFKDVSKIVTSYLTSNATDLRKYTPSSMVLSALKVSYPCGGE